MFRQSKNERRLHGYVYVCLYVCEENKMETHRCVYLLESPSNKYILRNALLIFAGKLLLDIIKLYFTCGSPAYGDERRGCPLLRVGVCEEEQSLSRV